MLLGRNQQATLEYLNASQYLRQISESPNGTGLLEFTSSFVNAVSFFGISELKAREAERAGILDVQSNKVITSLKASSQFNEKGFRTLSYARDSLKKFRDELVNVTDTKKYDDKFLIFQSELNEALVEVETKASDVKIISDSFTECFDLMKNKGVHSLPDYLEEKINNLEDIRKRPDRGAVQNIPLWKVAAIAVAVGVLIWAFFKCNYFECTQIEGIAYVTVFWIAALVTNYC